MTARVISMAAYQAEQDARRARERWNEEVARWERERQAKRRPSLDEILGPPCGPDAA